MNDNSADEHRKALVAEGIAIAALRGSVLNASDIGTFAVELALAGYEIFPLNGKIPAIPQPAPVRQPETSNLQRGMRSTRARCTGRHECRHPGNHLVE